VNQTLRIGEAAALGGVSCRTLRYYEELGLLAPAGRTPGGARRYGEADLARLAHIRELRDDLGFNLEEVGEVLAAEDRLASLREEYLAGGQAARRREILAEALQLNTRLRDRVEQKLARLGRMLDELAAKRRRYREVAASLERDAGGQP
jgi:DNA-binding transcriptional MerR regulator